MRWFVKGKISRLWFISSSIHLTVRDAAFPSKVDVVLINASELKVFKVNSTILLFSPYARQKKTFFRYVFVVIRRKLVFDSTDTTSITFQGNYSKRRTRQLQNKKMYSTRLLQTNK